MGIIKSRKYVDFKKFPILEKIQGNILLNFDCISGLIPSNRKNIISELIFSIIGDLYFLLKTQEKYISIYNKIGKKINHFNKKNTNNILELDYDEGEIESEFLNYIDKYYRLIDLKLINLLNNIYDQKFKKGEIIKLFIKNYGNDHGIIKYSEDMKENWIEPFLDTRILYIHSNNMDYCTNFEGFTINDSYITIPNIKYNKANISINSFMYINTNKLMEYINEIIIFSLNDFVPNGFIMYDGKLYREKS